MPLARRHFWRSRNSASLKECLTSQGHIYQGGSLDGWVSGCRETNGFGSLWAWWSLSLPLVDGEPLVFSFGPVPHALWKVIQQKMFPFPSLTMGDALGKNRFDQSPKQWVTGVRKGTRVFGSHGACWKVDHFWCEVNRVYSGAVLSIVSLLCPSEGIWVALACSRQWRRIRRRRKNRYWRSSSLGAPPRKYTHKSHELWN